MIDPRSKPRRRNDQENSKSKQADTVFDYSHNFTRINQYQGE